MKMIKIEELRNKFGLWYIAFITFLGIYLRLWWINNIPTKPIYDFETYQEIATNIFNHLGHSFRGEPIAFQGMGYPMVLGFVYRLVGNNDLYTAKMFNVVLSILTLILIFFILIKLTHRRFIVYTAYTFAALLPNFIAYNNVISTEVFITFILTAALFLQLYTFDPRIRYPLLGALIGVAALTKPFFMAYPVVIAVAVWLKGKDIKKTAILFATVFLCMALTVAPWTYRNYQKFGRFIPVSYNSGYVFYVNNNANNTTGAWMPLSEIYASPELRAKMDSILNHGARSEKLAHELEVIFKPEAKEWIQENPWEFTKLGLLRLNATFFSGAWDIEAWTANEFKEKQDWWTEIEYLRSANAFRAVTDFVINLLSAFGFMYVLLNVKNILWGLFKKDETLNDLITIPTLNIAFFIAIYFVFEGQARYNFPVLFFLILATVVILDRMKTSLYDKSSR
jgi:hypothetical protein